MEASYRREIDHNYLVLEDPSINGSEYTLRMLQENRLSSFLPLRIRRMNGKISLMYEITSRQPLSRLYEKRSLGSEDMERLFTGISKALDDAQRFLLDPDDFLLSPEMIYLDPDRKTINVCYCPGEEARQSAKKLGDFLLKHLDHADSGAVETGYRFFELIMQEHVSLREILEQLPILNEEAADRETVPEELFLRKEERGRRPAVWDENAESLGGRAERRSERGTFKEKSAGMERGTGKGTKIGKRKESGTGKGIGTGNGTAFGNDAESDNNTDRGSTTGVRADFPEVMEAWSDETWSDKEVSRRYGRKRKKRAKRKNQKTRVKREKQQKRTAPGAPVKRSDAQRKKTQKDMFLWAGLSACLFALAGGIVWFAGLDLTQAGGLSCLVIAVIWLLHSFITGREKNKKGIWGDQLEDYPDPEEEEEFYEALTKGTRMQEGLVYTPEQPAFMNEMPADRSMSASTYAMAFAAASASSPAFPPTAASAAQAAGQTSQAGAGQTRCIGAVGSSRKICLISEEPRRCRDLTTDAASVLVGKKQEMVDLCIPLDVISRIHARLDLEEETCYVTDLNSTNGTFVNGERLEPNERRRVGDGDQVRFASAAFRLRLRDF